MAGLASYAFNGATNYNPLIRWMKAYQGDHIIPTPLIAPLQHVLGRWGVDMNVIMPWTFDRESLRKASAELRSWIPHLVVSATLPWTYLGHVDFMFLAMGKAPS